MDKKEKQSFRWLPDQMPGVAGLMKEKRGLWGDAWVNECWQRGVVRLEPGWFYAGEGALSVGVLWDDPVIVAFAAARVTRTQALLVLRPPPAAERAQS